MRLICLILASLLGNPAIARVQLPHGPALTPYLFQAQITRPKAPKVHSTEEQIAKLREDIKKKRSDRRYILERYGINPNDSLMILVELSFAQAHKHAMTARKAAENAPTARNKRLAKETDAELAEAYKKLRQAFADVMKRFPEGSEDRGIFAANDTLYAEFREYWKLIVNLDECLQLLKKLEGK